MARNCSRFCSAWTCPSSWVCNGRGNQDGREQGDKSVSAIAAWMRQLTATGGGKAEEDREDKVFEPRLWGIGAR